MKYTIFLTSLVGLAAMPILAQQTPTPEPAAENQVDFSKAYIIIPEAPTKKSTTEKTETTPKLHIGGVKTLEILGDEVTQLNWTLSLDFNSNEDSFHLSTLPESNDFDPELLQQQLRDSVWTGEYKTVKNHYSTELRIQSVQQGFIGGEIIHTTAEEPEPSSFLHTKVVGDITTQYLIEEDEEEPIWIDVDQYDERVTQINKENEEKEEDDIAPTPTILDTRHLIRLKRTRRIGDPKHATSSWGAHNEYRLTLENNNITGGAGIPPDSFGVKDELRGNGQIELTRLLSPPVESTPSEPE